jgi:hypothetical protein
MQLAGKTRLGVMTGAASGWIAVAALNSVSAAATADVGNG